MLQKYRFAVRGQRSEVRRRKSEVRSQKSEVSIRYENTLQVCKSFPGIRVVSDFLLLTSDFRLLTSDLWPHFNKPVVAKPR